MNKPAARPREEICIGPVSELAEGKFKIVSASGTEIGVIRLRDGEYRAVRNHCPHKGAAVCQGRIGGTFRPSAPSELAFDLDGEVLSCPWHGWEFSLDTGVELFRARPAKLRLYPTEVRDGVLYVTI